MVSVPSSMIGKNSNCGCELDARDCGCKNSGPIEKCDECMDGFGGRTDKGCKKIMACDSTEFCCHTKIRGDQECPVKCISEDYLNDEEEDCENGSGRKILIRCCSKIYFL